MGAHENVRGLEINSGNRKKAAKKTRQGVREEIVGGERITYRSVVGDTMCVEVLTEQVRPDQTTEFDVDGCVRITKTESYQFSAVVDYKFIAHRTEINEDADFGAPWTDCDGYEHELVRLPHDDAKKAVGYVRHTADRYLVKVTTASFCGDQRAVRIARLRQNGASQQVAREVVADQDREYIHQIAKWHRGDYSYYSVECRLTMPDKVYDASVSGCFRNCHAHDANPEDTEYEQEQKREIIAEICDMLRKDGYTIVNRPKTKRMTAKAARLRNKIDWMRRSMQSQNRHGDRKVR